jgi:ABC-type Na+ efflux pump permease subunit
VDHGIAIWAPVGSEETEPLSVGPRPGRKLLMVCGIVSSLLYAAMLAFIPMLWEDYCSASQTVSELSAIDAPTRSVWVPVGIAWTLLYAAFGSGVW